MLGLKGGGPPLAGGTVGPAGARASDVPHLNTQVYRFWGQLLEIHDGSAGDGRNPGGPGVPGPLYL